MEFNSYEIVASNTASLNTGSYLNQVEYSMFVKGFTTDIWYGLSAEDTIEFSVWDRDNNFIGLDILNQSKSYNNIDLSYLNAINLGIEYSYSELRPDFILYKNSKILVNPCEQLSSSFQIASGSYFLNYNFTRELAGNSSNPLMIKEISPSRNEIKLIPVIKNTPAYEAFCQKKILINNVSPLYLSAVKDCPYDKIYNEINHLYKSEINTLKSLYFLNGDGNVTTFLKNLYEDFILYTSTLNTSTTTTTTDDIIRIQGIRTYFINYLLSKSNDIVDFTEIDNVYNTFVLSAIERKFKPIGKAPEYDGAKSFIYDFFTKYYYQPISDQFSKSYNDKYLSYLKNGLNVGDGRILPILNHGMLDERQSPSDALTLIIKLKSELPSDIMIQSLCWISNISLSPYIINSIIKEQSNITSRKIGPPNFSAVIPNVSLTNSNITYTSADLENTPSEDREINISKTISELNVDYTDFENFIVFSSAQIRLNIFKNKIIKLTNINDNITLLNNTNYDFLSTNGTEYPYYESEYSNLQSELDTVVNSFDGYESYLYRSGNYSYSSSSFISSSYIAEMDSLATEYDKTNRDSLANNCPSHILTDSNSDDYVIFLYMIGHFFDEIYEYISNLPSEKTISNKSTDEFTRRVVEYMLETFGWKLDDSLEQASLINNYLTSDQVDTENSMSAEERLKIIRNRVLINLPQIYKTKGTEESVRLLLSCYGIPSSLLSIREYGGVNYTSNDATYTTYERAYMYQWNSSSLNDSTDVFYTNLTSDAKTFIFKICLDDSSIYSYENEQALIGLVGSSTESTSLSGSGDWAIGFVREPSKNSGRMFFRIGYKGAETFKLYTPEFPLFNGEIYNVMLRRNISPDGYEFNTNTDAVPCSFDLYVQRNEFGNRILRLTSSKMSYDYNINHQFSTGTNNSYLVFGNWFKYHNGQGFVGAFDKLQVWYDPITDSNFEDYANSINSFSFSGSHPAHQSLLFRMHTDYPFDAKQISPGNVVPVIGNNPTRWVGTWVNANPFYAVNSQAKVEKYLDPYYAANMDTLLIWNPSTGSQEVRTNASGCLHSQSTYPYQFRVVDYPSTWGISKYGPNKFHNEKIRHIFQSIDCRLDDNNRSTYVNDSDVMVDSNQIGFFVDPQDFTNKNIVRYFGNFDFMNSIGDPSNQFSSSYKSLRNFRKQYATSLNEYSGSHTLFNELITLYKLYFNKSIFESIKNLVPARSNVLTGILIEPTILERPKYESKPVYSEVNTGSVFYADVVAKHYIGDTDTKLLHITQSTIDFGMSSSITMSYIMLPTRDYPINYGGNYIADLPDPYELGHFAPYVDSNITVDFEIISSPASPGSSILFRNLSVNTLTYLWDFGDNSSQVFDKDPSHSYSSPGTYTVTLIAYDFYGHNARIAKQVTITQQINLTANFSATPLTGNSPLTVQFTNESNGATSYTWYFGDVNNTTSESTNPSFTYTSPGLYTVTLIARISSGMQATKTRTQYINVGNTSVPTVVTPPGIIDEDSFDGGNNGCPAVWQLMLTKELGWIRADEIKVGMHIQGISSEWVKVYNATIKPAPIWECVLDNETFYVDDNHKWQGQHKNFIKVKYMIIGDKVSRVDGTFSTITSNKFYKDDYYVSLSVEGEIFAMCGQIAHNDNPVKYIKV